MKKTHYITYIFYSLIIICFFYEYTVVNAEQSVISDAIVEVENNQILEVETSQSSDSVSRTSNNSTHNSSSFLPQTGEKELLTWWIPLGSILTIVSLVYLKRNSDDIL